MAYLTDLFTLSTSSALAGDARTHSHDMLGRGYQYVGERQPQTIGYALADSPVALLAWMWEKMARWVDVYQWDDDESGSVALSRSLYSLFNNLSSYVGVHVLVLACRPGCFIEDLPREPHVMG